MINRKLMRVALSLTMAAGVALTGITNARAQALKADAALPVYQKVSGVSGTLSSVGSDTLNNLLTLWSEGFRKLYPNVNIQVEGKGSSTAPPALIEGTAQLGPMSRKMKSEEMDKFEGKYGFKPTNISVAIDTLAIYVHKDNPVKSLSLVDVDAIFSKNRRGGGTKDLNTWGALGLNGAWSNRAISLYGRNSASGTYGFFKEHALFKGDFKDRVKEQPGSASVVQGVESDLGAIGYSGIGYRTSGVRIVPLAKKPGEPAFEPDYGNALSGKYPLSRALYIYVAKAPGKPLDKLTSEFLKFVLSRQGQEIVIKDGYLPLPAKLAEKEAGVLK